MKIKKYDFIARGRSIPLPRHVFFPAAPAAAAAFCAHLPRGRAAKAGGEQRIQPARSGATTDDEKEKRSSEREEEEEDGGSLPSRVYETFPPSRKMAGGRSRMLVAAASAVPPGVGRHGNLLDCLLA